MEGFFSKHEFEDTSIKYSCASCGLYKYCQSPKMEAYGKFKKKILIVADTPDDFEDQQGVPFRGRRGRVFRRFLEPHGIDMYEDCLITFAVKCSTKKPTMAHVNSCRRFVLNIIKKKNPHIVILAGELAVKSVIGSIWKKDIGTIHKWRGFKIPDQKYKCWICPVYSPNFVLERDEKQVDLMFKKDMLSILGLLDKPVPIRKEPEIEYIEELSPLKKLGPGSVVTFDYETTGLKPQAPGHRILCASVADSPDHVWVFEMPKTRKGRKPLIDVLTNDLIYKIAHNMKYEDNWTNVRLGVQIKNWAFDTQIAAHIIDNRPDIVSLKFQTYVRLGIGDYDSEIAPYLKAKTPNSMNKAASLLKSPEMKMKLLKYCALDSSYTYDIANQMMKEMDYYLLPF